MSFNEWFLENDDLVEGVDCIRLKNAWEMLENEGVSSDLLPHIFGQIITAVFNFDDL